MAFKEGQSPFSAEKHPNAKLTNEQAREIQRRRASGESGASLAREYRIDPGTISRICNGTRWQRATGLVAPEGEKKEVRDERSREEEE